MAKISNLSHRVLAYKQIDKKRFSEYEEFQI